MANLKDVKRDPIKITLQDGVERTLRFTLNALAELEKEYGSVDNAFAKIDENSIIAIRFILWAGLMHEDENLTVAQVGNLIDLNYMNELMVSLGSALSSDMPDDGQAKAVQAAPEAGKDPNVARPAVTLVTTNSTDGTGRL